MHVFLFFRDFRLTDNLGLVASLKKYKRVLPIFVFTPVQIDPAKNPYFSPHSFQFLCESLEDLAGQIKTHKGRLYIFYDDLITALNKIYERHPFSSLSFNMDYTPYARKRTASLQAWCKHRKVSMDLYEDYLLAPIGSFLRDSGKPYHVYSFFKNSVYKRSHLIQKPSSFQAFSFEVIKDLESMVYPLEKVAGFSAKNQFLLLKGGRKQGRFLLDKLPKGYDDKRNDLTFSTSHLAAYIKYGALSVREVFDAFQESGQLGLQDQLIWREFYTYIAYYFPEVLQGAYWQKKYEKIQWLNSPDHLQAWQRGETGYPIVDACMRELNSTGYMHNRGRLIAANFLNRLLHIDWRKGERYFAQKLIDYDPAVNNGNWQWVASTGVDPKPYFQRLFNPFLQSKKFDPGAKYIKKWLPQLAGVPAEHLHAWEDCYHLYDLKQINYYAPIVNYREARARSFAAYRFT